MTLDSFCAPCVRARTGLEGFDAAPQATLLRGRASCPAALRICRYSLSAPIRVWIPSVSLHHVRPPRSARFHLRRYASSAHAAHGSCGHALPRVEHPRSWRPIRPVLPHARVLPPFPMFLICTRTTGALLFISRSRVLRAPHPLPSCRKPRPRSPPICILNTTFTFGGYLPLRARSAALGLDGLALKGGGLIGGHRTRC
jgi:hypothetical protein